jgi:hypothetical protein
MLSSSASLSSTSAPVVFSSTLVAMASGLSPRGVAKRAGRARLRPAAPRTERAAATSASRVFQPPTRRRLRAETRRERRAGWAGASVPIAVPVPLPLPPLPAGRVAEESETCAPNQRHLAGLVGLRESPPASSGRGSRRRHHAAARAALAAPRNARSSLRRQAAPSGGECPTSQAVWGSTFCLERFRGGPFRLTTIAHARHALRETPPREREKAYIYPQTLAYGRYPTRLPGWLSGASKALGGNDPTGGAEQGSQRLGVVTFDFENREQRLARLIGRIRRE